MFKDKLSLKIQDGMLLSDYDTMNLIAEREVGQPHLDWPCSCAFHSTAASLTMLTGGMEKQYPLQFMGLL